MENYTAHIKVVKVTRADTSGRTVPSHEPPRQKTEALELTVKAPTLERLKEKVTSHVALLDEDDVS